MRSARGAARRGRMRPPSRGAKRLGVPWAPIGDGAHSSGSSGGRGTQSSRAHQLGGRSVSAPTHTERGGGGQTTEHPATAARAPCAAGAATFPPLARPPPRRRRRARAPGSGAAAPSTPPRPAMCRRRTHANAEVHTAATICAP